MVIKKARTAESGMFYSLDGVFPDPLLSTMALWTVYFDRNGTLRSIHGSAPDLISRA